MLWEVGGNTGTIPLGEKATEEAQSLSFPLTPPKSHRVNSQHLSAAPKPKGKGRGLNHRETPVSPSLPAGRSPTEAMHSDHACNGLALIRSELHSPLQSHWSVITREKPSSLATGS